LFSWSDAQILRVPYAEGGVSSPRTDYPEAFSWFFHSTFELDPRPLSLDEPSLRGFFFYGFSQFSLPSVSTPMGSGSRLLFPWFFFPPIPSCLIEAERSTPNTPPQLVTLPHKDITPPPPCFFAEPVPCSWFSLSFFPISYPCFVPAPQRYFPPCCARFFPSSRLDACQGSPFEFELLFCQRSFTVPKTPFL